MNIIYLPVIIQGNPVPLSLGVQIEGRVGDRVQWVIPNRQYQIHVKWRDVETIKGVCNWSLYDPDFEALAGQRVTAGIKVVPEWARLWAGYIASPPKVGCYIDLANFILALIKKYNPDAVEIFNEPDVDRDAAKWAEEYFGSWCVSSNWYAGGKLYGQCLKAIYPIVHAEHSNVRIIAGALMGHDNSLTFLQGAIDGGLQCDCVSFHKYIGLGGDFNAAYKFANQISLKSSKSIILSETSVINSVDSDELKNQQADYLAHLKSTFMNSNVDVIQWYTLANNMWGNADLVRNSVPTLAYKEWRE